MKQLIVVSHSVSFAVKQNGENGESVEREMRANGLGTVLSRLVARVEREAHRRDGLHVHVREDVVGRLRDAGVRRVGRRVLEGLAAAGLVDPVRTQAPAPLVRPGREHPRSA